MVRTRIKFCGLTREQDVLEAIAAGADAVGFVCAPASPRHVPPARLAELERVLSPFVTPVLLFVDAPPDLISDCLHHVPDAILQFHGSESEPECSRWGRPWMKAVPMGEQGAAYELYEQRYGGALALLADAAAAGQGGSGERFDWGRIPPPGRRRIPLVLAGGLDAENVGEAIAAVGPEGVDVSSGIEIARGVKGAHRMRAFVAAVRAADALRQAHAPAQPAGGPKGTLRWGRE